jgi:hypothetical protein
LRVYLGGGEHLQRGLAFTWRNKITCRTMAETAVYLVAHELRHLWQYESGRPMRNDPKERDADAYAARCLRRWRRRHAPAPVLARLSTAARVAPDASTQAGRALEG